MPASTKRVVLFRARIAMGIRNRLRPPVAILGERSEFAYVPIPKNATSSVKRALLEHLQLRPPQRARHVHSRSVPWRTLPLDRALEDPRIYRFAFVRNPWDRLYSSWYDKVRSPGSGSWFRPLAGIPTTIGFPEFVEWVTSLPAAGLEEHLRPQCAFLVREGECRMDFVGRVESIDSDWARLSARLGLGPLTHRNRAADGDRVAWNKDSARRVAEFYGEDAERFGYRPP